MSYCLVESATDIGNGNVSLTLSPVCGSVSRIYITVTGIASEYPPGALVEVNDGDSV